MSYVHWIYEHTIGTFMFDKITFLIFSGPEKWPELFPMASGHRQSPVNINRESTTRGSTLKTPLTWKYVPENTKVHFSFVF